MLCSQKGRLSKNEQEDLQPPPHHWWFSGKSIYMVLTFRWLPSGFLPCHFFWNMKLNSESSCWTLVIQLTSLVRNSGGQTHLLLLAALTLPGGAAGSGNPHHNSRGVLMACFSLILQEDTKRGEFQFYNDVSGKKLIHAQGHQRCFKEF